MVELNHLGPVISAAVALVAAVAVGGLLLTNLFLAVVHLRRSRPRPDTWRGVARAAEGGEAEPIAKVTSEQVGRPTTVLLSQGTDWVETARTHDLRPFVLETADGQRLVVEPDARTVVRAQLSADEPHGDDRRRRFGWIRPGAEVHVRARLEASERRGEGAYREVQVPSRLVVPPGERMIVSTEPLGARNAGLARFHVTAVGIALALLGLQALAGGDYLALLRHGEVVEGDPVDTWCYRHANCTAKVRVGGQLISSEVAEHATPFTELSGDVTSRSGRRRGR